LAKEDNFEFVGKK